MKIIKGLVTFILQTWTTTGIALKRLLTQRLLSIAAIAGLLIAAGLIFSVPLYAEATYFRLFREELLAGREADLATKPVDYAPLAFTFELKAAGRESPQWQDAVAADGYLSGEALRSLQLPVLHVIRRFHTNGFFMYPPPDPKNPGGQYSLTTADFALITPAKDTIQMVAGTLPQPSSLLGGNYIQAIASETIAEKFGVQVGDIYYLRGQDIEIPVSIVGLWRPVDPKAPYWDSLSDTWLLVHEDSYTGSLSSVIDDELRNSVWSLVVDGSNLHASDIAGLDKRIHVIQQRVDTLLPKTVLISSPLDALARYQANAPSLTYLLFAFSVPILGLIVAFMGLVAGLFVGQQRGEMAILRSRGASIFQIVWIALLQGILLGIVALAGGILLGYGIAHAIGQARSFLDFGATGGLRVSMTLSTLGYGILGISLILLIQILIPTLTTAKNTIVTYKQERARLLLPPWWQRYWIDLILLALAGYGLWILQKQSRLVSTGTESIPDPLQNPLLLLIPAIGIFAAALFTLRLVPRLMELTSRVLRPTKSVGLLMAARYLARTPAFYNAPLVLLVLTLGLSAFTASLAKTLDNQLEKQMYYQVGSDMRVYELGTTVNEDNQDFGWTFRPVEEHLSLPGVKSVTRVGRYGATAIVPSGAAEGTFLGIERLTFPGTAYWQNNFADQSIGSLMNTLGAEPNGVLVPKAFLEKEGLNIGDSLSLGIKTAVAGKSVGRKLKIVGVFDLFPTWYPENGPLFVANLDEFFIQAGGDYPHEVWMGTNNNVDPEDVIYAVRGYSILLDQQADFSRLVANGLNTQVKEWWSTELNILTEQRRPERQGLFGLLSVGFIASALLTVLGFLLYALFSFRRRFIEMGMLRAIGLSVNQMIALLASELAFLILLGIGAGTLLGFFTSKLFVPFLQIGATTQAQYPPFEIVIAWFAIFQIYALFVILFLAALGVLTSLLLRMKIFQAIKLGETS